MKKCDHTLAVRNKSNNDEDKKSLSAHGGRNIIEYETTLLKLLHSRKSNLLQILEDVSDCPDSYRNAFYKIMFAIEVSQKEAYDNLREIKQEVGKVAFNLQINPAWLRGVLELVEEIITQAEGDPKDRNIVGMAHLNRLLDLTMNACIRYRLSK